MYNNLEISLVVFMPNITKNRAITFTCYLKRFNIKVSNFINFVCYFNFVPCLQFTAEASQLQELNVKWKQQVNQRDAELYTKYGGALDLEV